jgi:alkyldihydroxyacetonephosphate synthase
MARLSDPQETEINLALAGKERILTMVEGGLKLLGYGSGRSLLIFGVTGDPASAGSARNQASAIARAHGGLVAGARIGESWRHSRFLTPYLRNTLWERGYALDALETALPWSSVIKTAGAIKDVLREGLAAFGERVLAFAHLSHFYPDGANIYVTFLFRRTEDPDETLEYWQTLKAAASQTIQAHGGTISHQHGVGRDHLPYLMAEKGPVGITLLTAAHHALDPEGLLNPGKLLP